MRTIKISLVATAIVLFLQQTQAQPSISVTLKQISGGVNGCLPKAVIVDQEVCLKNTGDTAVSEIAVVLNVSGNIPQTSLHTIYKTIHPNDTAIIKMEYIVPSQSNYFVNAIAYMVSDSALVNNATTIQECVETEDIAITGCIKPQMGQTDSAGRSQEIAVSLRNYSDTQNYYNVGIRAWIEDSNRNRIATEISEIVPVIYSLSDTIYTFATKYTVPNEGRYFIKIFIDKVDHYPWNDSLYTMCHSIGQITQLVGVYGIHPIQIYPNPTTGQITITGFPISDMRLSDIQIYDIIGKLQESRISEIGKSEIVLDISHLSNGLYFLKIDNKMYKISKN